MNLKKLAILLVIMLGGMTVYYNIAATDAEHTKNDVNNNPKNDSKGEKSN